MSLYGLHYITDAWKRAMRKEKTAMPPWFEHCSPTLQAEIKAIQAENFFRPITLQGAKKMLVSDLVKEMAMKVLEEHGIRLIEVSMAWEDYSTISDQRSTIKSVEIMARTP